MQPDAMDWGALSDVNAYSSSFLTTCLQSSVMFAGKSSLEQKRLMKSVGVVELFMLSLSMSSKRLQPLVMAVMLRLNILAISLAERGTWFFLHDM